MKQKYIIAKADDGQSLSIRELAELDKDSFSPLCEENYLVEDIQKAMDAGKEALLAQLRTKNFYPPGVYTEQIAIAVINLVRSQEDQATELVFDDSNLLKKAGSPEDAIPSLETDADVLDDLLDEDFTDDYDEEKDPIKNISVSLKVADDEYSDSDEET